MPDFERAKGFPIFKTMYDRKRVAYLRAKYPDMDLKTLLKNNKVPRNYKDL
jgi:hypothetical protein